LIFAPVHDGSMMNKPEKFILRHQGNVERISIRNALNLGKQLLIKGGLVNKTGSFEYLDYPASLY